MKNLLHYLKQGNNFLSISLGLGFLLIAISISYSLLIKPAVRSLSLGRCLDSIQEQKEVLDERYSKTISERSNFATTTGSSAYDKYLTETKGTPSAPDPRMSPKAVSDAEAKCYDRYK